MKRARVELIGAVVLAAAAAGCKPTKAGRKVMEPATMSDAEPAGFRLSGEFFELSLPAGWGPHPQQQQMQDFGAVSGHNEMIVATHLGDDANAQAMGVTFEEALRQLAEARREASIAYAADPQHVEPVQSQRLGDVPALTYRARLSRPPLTGVTQLTVILGVPGVRACTSSERPVLTISLYDYDGGTPDALFTFARDLLGPLKLKAYVQS